MSTVDREYRSPADASAGLGRVSGVHRVWRTVAILALVALALLAALAWVQRSGRALFFVPADQIRLAAAPRSAVAVSGVVYLPPLQADGRTAASADQSPGADPGSLEAYRSIAAETIAASERTVELVKWLVTSSLALAGIVVGGAAYLYNRTMQATANAEDARRQSELSLEMAEQAKQQASDANELVNTSLVVARRLERAMDSALTPGGAQVEGLERAQRVNSMLANAATLPEGDEKRAAYQEAAWAKYHVNRNVTGLLELREAARIGLTDRVKLEALTEWVRLQMLGDKRNSKDARAFQELSRILGYPES